VDTTSSFGSSARDALWKFGAKEIETATESTIATNEADFCNVSALCHVELMGQFSTTRAGIPFLRLSFQALVSRP
jgi:hypothetical protein